MVLSRNTMIPDSAPHRTLKISELARAIASQLILISQASALDLACACRCLEEPVLSTLWETQESLCTLMGVLPKDTLLWETLEHYTDVVCSRDPPLEEPNAQVYSSCGSWGTHRQRLGRESSATRPGCAKSL